MKLVNWARDVNMLKQNVPNWNLLIWNLMPNWNLLIWNLTNNCNYFVYVLVEFDCLTEKNNNNNNKEQVITLENELKKYKHLKDDLNQLLDEA